VLTILPAFGGGFANAADVTSDQDLAAYPKCIRSAEGQGEPLDLTGAQVTFEDEFDTPDIVEDGRRGKWFTGVHSDFSGAKFLPYSKGSGPFLYGDGHLTIRMEKRGGRWVSGMINSVDSKGRGFSQSLGYFEMRAIFPKGHSNYPGFWLEWNEQYVNKTLTRPEIDVVEAYGGNDPGGYHAALHLWPKDPKLAEPGQITKPWGMSCYRRLVGHPFDGQFHTYGVLLTDKWVIIYYDRRELMRFVTLPEMRRPMFMMVDLAYFIKETRTDQGPSDMVIDYVRAWRMPER
jgi:beta-glucanase (GH16 family)